VCVHSTLVQRTCLYVCVSCELAGACYADTLLRRGLRAHAASPVACAVHETWVALRWRWRSVYGGDN
jgi:hypothetical protein